MSKELSILIVEDEPLISMHLSLLLEKEGHSILGIATKANEAEELTEKMLPDLMFVDIKLNGSETGIDFVEKIRKKSNLPVIYLTSNSDQLFLEQAKKTNPNGFITKPFTDTQIKAFLEIAVHQYTHTQKTLEQKDIHIAELSETNSHLITATWRERELKQKLVTTLNELNTTKLLVEAQNKRIAESINYARRIQLAINTTEAQIKKSLSDSFILFKPKDVISGDFPWFFQRDQFIYIAAVDCTGHGVPGAMMSMIGNLLLNDIVNDTTIYTPAEVLARLHKAVVNTLKQDQEGNNSNDGMDVAICRINKETNELVYSGAHRPLFYLNNQKVDVFSGDKFPIGGTQYKGKNNYTDHSINIKSGDAVLFFSDGFPDQIGGPETKKYMTGQIKEVFEKKGHLNMNELKVEMETEFNAWLGSNKQIDDILMIGIRF